MSYVKELRKKIGHDEHIGVGAGIFPCRGGQVLLQRRKDNGCWSLHAGGMEIGETVEETARRELLEETGLAAGRLQLLGVFSGNDMRYTYPNGDRVCAVIIAYVCEDFSGTPVPQPCEVAQLKWFPIDALPENISPPDQRVFRAFSDFMAEKAKAHQAVTAPCESENATTP